MIEEDEKIGARLSHGGGGGGEGEDALNIQITLSLAAPVSAFSK